MRATVSAGGTPAADANGVDWYLDPGQNLMTGEAEFTRYFPGVTTLERDALTVAAAVLACDILEKRGERESITRSIELTIPVVNFHAFNGLRDQLEHILYVLSHDNWSITFTRAEGNPEAHRQWQVDQGRTLLFSGGLDSLAAAVDLFDESGPGPVQLASHLTGNPSTRGSQQHLCDYLSGRYESDVQRVALRTGVKGTGTQPVLDKDREVSQRTRSFTFLTIAALAARRRGMNEVVMIAENGQMAIHVPLSAARIGAFSTHTAHPEFVKSAEDFFTILLGYQIRILNPFLYRTKAEVVSNLAQSHAEAIPQSVSCWRSARVASNHCGQCIPCYVRRIALEYHGVVLPEYEVDLFVADVAGLDYQHEGKRNLTELAEFIHAFRTMGDAELDFSYPALTNEWFSRDDAVAMYRRFAGEADAVLRRYPYLAHLVGPEDAAPIGAAT